MKVGISTVGIASLGISPVEDAVPASFFLEGAAERTVFPSYRCAVSPDFIAIIFPPQNPLAPASAVDRSMSGSQSMMLTPKPRNSLIKTSLSVFKTS